MTATSISTATQDKHARRHDGAAASTGSDRARRLFVRDTSSSSVASVADSRDSRESTLTWLASVRGMWPLAASSLARLLAGLAWAIKSLTPAAGFR
jgi:hypothetical protein